MPPGDVALDRALGLRLDRFDRLDARARGLGLGDVDRAACQQDRARGSRGQFRQGHFYRHELYSRFLSGSLEPEEGSANFPVLAGNGTAPLPTIELTTKNQPVTRISASPHRRQPGLCQTGTAWLTPINGFAD